MKPSHIAPPLLALALVGVWLNRSWTELESMRAEVRTLRQQTGAALDAGSGGSRRDRGPGTSPTSGGRIHWHRIAGLMGEGAHGIFGRQELLRAEMRMRAMSPSELRAALQEIASLQIDARDRNDLQEKLIRLLAEKDPASALDLVTGDARITVYRYYFERDLFLAWAGRDLSAAGSWLDMKIAAGDFNSKALDGRNPQRTTMEAAMLVLLIGVDPAAATARLTALPEDQRAGVLTGSAEAMKRKAGDIPEKDLTTFAALVRATLPAGQQTAVITRPVGSLAMQRGYEKIDRYLETVSASPAERASSVAAAAGVKFRFLADGSRLSVEEMDRFRAWAASQSPDRVDAIMASSLTGLCSNGSSTAPKARDLAIHYHAQTGNDQILVHFVRGAAGGFGKEKLLSMAELIKDPEIRKRTIEEVQNNPFAQP